jgi:hypothetical protein
MSLPPVKRALPPTPSNQEECKDYSRKLSCRFLGGVMPLVNAALANQASEGWLRALDVSLNRRTK